MRKSYLLKRTLSLVFTKGFFVLAKLTTRFCGLLFAKRTILFVTNEKIKSVSLGPLSQIILLLFLTWVGNLFIQSMHYDQVINARYEEISRLRTVNSYFEDEVNAMNEKLEKVNEYLISITGDSHLVESEEMEKKIPKSFKEEDISKKDKHTLNKIRKADQKIFNIQSIATARTKKIEEAISITGLNIKKIPSKVADDRVKEISLNDEKDFFTKQGGPIDDYSNDEISKKMSLSEDSIERHLERSKFVKTIDRLVVLENLAKMMPFSRPIKNYYVSSGFGSRIDPITRRHAEHKGLDFVGPEGEGIISPSDGTIILAGKFSNYGNAVVINHGFGITTRYGHLSEVKVNVGQKVKKGEVIAIQGNSGRSTGTHLHYEVRYKNVPLNPKKFLEAGDALFNDDKMGRYVNS